MKLTRKPLLAVGIMLAAIVFVGRATATSIDPAPFPVQSQIPSKVKILVYHSIAPIPPTKESAMARHYRITPEDFDLQMAYLQARGYHTITLAALIANISHNVIPSDKEVVLTFDDGWENQYVYAVPILEKYGFTATFGIISENVGSSIQVASTSATESNTIGMKMTWAQIEDLQARGFEIASHSETHPFLTTVTDQQLLNEISGSKKEIESKLGTPITTFIYPYYNYDARTEKAVQNAGYLGARAGYNIFKNSSDHLYELVSQEAIDTPDPFSRQ